MYPGETSAAIVRLLILVGGLAIGGGVYTYGTFHALFPTRAQIAAVASCGDLKRGGTLPLDAVDTIRVDEDAFYCLDSSGEWRVTRTSNLPFIFGLAIAFGSAVVAMWHTTYAKWLASSLLGHLVLGATMFGIPFTLLGLQLNFIEGTLTRSWALQGVLIGETAGLVSGAVFWFVITPGLNRKGQRRR